MKRQVLDSECIASMRYSAKRRELEIEYRENREVYRYFDVPPEEYAAFMDAKSQGTYLDRCSSQRGMAIASFKLRLSDRAPCREMAGIEHI